MHRRLFLALTYNPDIDFVCRIVVDRDININDFHIGNQLRFCLRKNSDSQTGQFSIKINLLFFRSTSCCVHIFMQFANIS